MPEVLLVRHAQSYANKRNFAAFGNVDSPLTDKGIEQSIGLWAVFRDEYDIDPLEYDQPVLASEYIRPQQTAERAGFRYIHVNPLINESDVDRDIMSGVDVIAKHQAERWAAKESHQRARRFIELVRTGELVYKIYFSHGMFIASVLLELDQQQESLGHIFDKKRGFVPLQATIIQTRL